MIKKLITLFKLARKIAKSDILKITSKFQEPPLVVKILFKILAFSFSKKKKLIPHKMRVKDYQIYLNPWVLRLLNLDNF